MDRRLGNLGDVVEFIRTAKDRGMRVIADFVLNHTSDKHPWFVESRKSVRQPVPRLLRLAQGHAPGHFGAGGVPGRGDVHLDPGQGHR